MHFADPGGTSAAGIDFLKEHGIHIMKDDDSHSVIQSALKSGRCLKLSEAGKFVLKNSLDTDVFPTTSGSPGGSSATKPNSLALSRPKILRGKQPLVPLKKKVIHMTANEYQQLFTRDKKFTPSPAKIKKVERDVLEKLPQETTITMQQHEQQQPQQTATATELEKRVQELEKKYEMVLNRLDSSLKQNQEYLKRIETIEAIMIHRPS